MLGSCPDAADAIVQSSRPSGSARVHQVHQRKYEHPHDIDKVPIEAGGFDVIRVQPPTIVTPCDHGKSHHSRNHVKQVKARDAEKCGSEVDRAAGRIAKKAPAVSEHVKPLTKMQTREDNSEEYREPDPLDGFVFVAGPGSTNGH